MKKQKPEMIFTQASDNVFVDLGLPNPQEDLAKAELAHKITSTLKIRGFTQHEAAQQLGVYQPRISDLVNGKISKFTIDNLFDMLNKLDLDVLITTKDKPKSREHGAIFVKTKIALNA